jgi:hypothetical protein
MNKNLLCTVCVVPLFLSWWYPYHLPCVQRLGHPALRIVTQCCLQQPRVSPVCCLLSKAFSPPVWPSLALMAALELAMHDSCSALESPCRWAPPSQVGCTSMVTCNKNCWKRLMSHDSAMHPPTPTRHEWGAGLHWDQWNQGVHRNVIGWNGLNAPVLSEFLWWNSNPQGC